MAYVGRPPSNATLSSADIADGIIVAADLAPDSVGASELADDAVDTAAIADSVTLVTPNLGTPSAVTLTNATFPAGHIIQTKGDTYAPSSKIDIPLTGSGRVLGTNLEVEITCNSTSNYLLLSAFIPNWINRGQYYYCNYGFEYSTDSFGTPGTTLGTSFINTVEGYLSVAETIQMALHPYLWVQVPTVTTMKVQLKFVSVSGVTSIFWNANTDQQVATFTVQEVQQ